MRPDASDEQIRRSGEAQKSNFEFGLSRDMVKLLSMCWMGNRYGLYEEPRSREAQKSNVDFGLRREINLDVDPSHSSGLAAPLRGASVAHRTHHPTTATIHAAKTPLTGSSDIVSTSVPLRGTSATSWEQHKLNATTTVGELNVQAKCACRRRKTFKKERQNGIRGTKKKRKLTSRLKPFVGRRYMVLGRNPQQGIEWAGGGGGGERRREGGSFVSRNVLHAVRTCIRLGCSVAQSAKCNTRSAAAFSDAEPDWDKYVAGDQPATSQGAPANELRHTTVTPSDTISRQQIYSLY
ncbi:hypothetical protein DFH06DRAFT_1128370 [Mycena polygramma]|nr:hypothetical protein DFH06DRAFT_1128370 [Mycena polygramma]